MAAYSSVPADDESANSLEAGLLSTGDEEKICRLAPNSSTPQPSGSMSPLRRLTLAVLLGMFLGLGLSLAKEYTTRPCLSGPGSVVVIEQRPDSTHALGRLLQSWIPNRLANNLAASPPALAGLAKRQNDITGGGNATSPTTSSSQPQTSTTAPSTTETALSTADASTTTPSATTPSSAVDGSSSSPATSSSPTIDLSAVPVTSSLADLVPFNSGGYDDFFHAAASTDNFGCHDIVVLDPGGIVLYNSRYVYYGRATSTNVFVLQCSSLHILVFQCSSFHDFTLFHILFHILLFFYVAEDSSSPTTTTDSRRTITTGRVSTSSAVRTTWTTTLDNGGVTTLTSTSWVAVVPSETAAASSGREADLQNAASRMQMGATVFATVAALAVGVMLA
ncbi:hypothetical protein CP533_6007 [Ophiocordyceps camponoti-saundersi (nom. inval.)]|nr:hypothetical protein CP533_6007 [Ophiocordyceps camponoti-saundersi (nom. inval.)]